MASRSGLVVPGHGLEQRRSLKDGLVLADAVIAGHMWRQKVLSSARVSMSMESPDEQPRRVVPIAGHPFTLVDVHFWHILRESELWCKLDQRSSFKMGPIPGTEGSVSVVQISRDFQLQYSACDANN